MLSVPTVRFLEKQYGGPLEPVRLRANVLLDLPDGRPFEEDRWIGRQLWIGDVLLEIVVACERCVVPTPRRRDARAIARDPVGDRCGRAGGLIGVSARALTGNRLRVGDPVAIVD